MSDKKGKGKKENDEVTIKIKGEVLERVLKERAKKERETKKPVSIAEVVKGLLLGRV